MVTEGIETKAMWDAVRDVGPNVCQGYYFSKPLPSSKFFQHVVSWHAAQAAKAAGLLV